MLKNESTHKIGVKNKRLAAGLIEAYLEQVLVSRSSSAIREELAHFPGPY